MNTGQMMITIGAIMLMTLVILRINNTMLSTNTVLNRSKFGILATSIASSIIEQATELRFDENTISGDRITDVNLFTTHNGLGKDSGENVLENFDDFDDFNGYSFTTSDSAYIAIFGDEGFSSINFEVECKVYYVNTSNLDDTSFTQTWHKKIEVSVTSDFMKDYHSNEQDTVKLSSINSYWFFL